MTTIHIRPMSDDINTWLSLFDILARIYTDATVISSWDSDLKNGWLGITIQSQWGDEDITTFEDLIKKDLIAHWNVTERT